MSCHEIGKSPVVLLQRIHKAGEGKLQPHTRRQNSGRNLNLQPLTIFQTVIVKSSFESKLSYFFKESKVFMFLKIVCIHVCAEQ